MTDSFIFKLEDPKHNTDSKFPMENMLFDHSCKQTCRNKLYIEIIGKSRETFYIDVVARLGSFHPSLGTSCNIFQF